MNTRYDLFDIPFSTLSAAATTEHVIALSQEKKASSVILCNAHVIVEADWDQTFKDELKKADLIIPDGMPVAWILHAKGQKQTERLSGIDLMEEVFKTAPQTRHFFLGSSPQALRQIEQKFKGHLAGCYSPPFSPRFSDEEMKKQLELVEKSKADFIWVGLGAPKQEKFVLEMASRASTGVWLAVGAAFDFYAGLKPRAPKLMQKAGLEWAFRLLSEPRRLAKRYATTNPVFIKLAVQELLKRENPL